MASIRDLLEIMRRLRGPGGCPWDREQTFASIAPFTIEEAYEVADAIDRGDLAALKEELGDLLFQVVFHAAMAQEAGAFDFDDVLDAILAKMIRRHPHVFDRPDGRDAQDQSRAWEAMKASERSDGVVGAGVLDGVALALPALTRALKLSRRAARVGFVWPNIEDVLAKLEEEIAELRVEIARGDKQAAAAELGDMLFVCANIARELDADPETALRGANAKFTRRFAAIERALRTGGRSTTDATLAEMEAHWQAAKAEEV